MDEPKTDLRNLDQVVADLGNQKKFRPKEPVIVPPALGVKTREPEGYIPDPGLVSAIRVALHLRKPLLLTGEPGTGKTDLAYYLSWKLGHKDLKGEPRKPLVFVAKSESTGQDLFYTYDTIGRFRDKSDSRPDIDFLTFNALGKAILWANPSEIKKRLPEKFEYPGQQQSVVLIDEVDKASRDFPNDILDELDRRRFSVKEVPGEPFETPFGMDPIIVITSNLEKNLPGPFLRRCVFYHIPFPEDGLVEIAASRIQFFNSEEGKKSALMQSAVELFLRLRTPDLDLQKKPATGELLDWLLYLVRQAKDPESGLQIGTPIWKRPDLINGSLSALIKDRQDFGVAAPFVKEWMKGQASGK